jgi:hypothetical protein
MVTDIDLPHAWDQKIAHTLSIASMLPAGMGSGTD